MTRLGWVILALILVAGAGFASLVRIGGAPARRIATAPVPPAAGLLAVPVAGVRRAALVDSWGDPRGGGTRVHHGTDIPAPAGTAGLAAAPGRVEKLFESGAGGTTIYERSADGRWIYYYAHLSGYAPGLHEGQAVRAGEPIGSVGDTGDAGAGNFHLHFGLSRASPRDGWWQGEPVNPFPLLAGRPGRR